MTKKFSTLLLTFKKIIWKCFFCFVTRSSRYKWYVWKLINEFLCTSLKNHTHRVKSFLQRTKITYIFNRKCTLLKLDDIEHKYNGKHIKFIHDEEKLPHFSFSYSPLPFASLRQNYVPEYSFVREMPFSTARPNVSFRKNLVSWNLLQKW